MAYEVMFATILAVTSTLYHSTPAKVFVTNSLNSTLHLDRRRQGKSAPEDETNNPAAGKNSCFTIDQIITSEGMTHGTSLCARLVQLHEQLHEQLHNFNSQTTNSLPNSLVSFSENSLSQS
jgi:hypothetical protein